LGFEDELPKVKYDKNPNQECAGRVEESAGCAEFEQLEQRSEPFMDRAEILRAIKEAYGSGRSIESAMRQCMAISRARVVDRQPPMLLPEFEYGRAVYRKRRCGKIASFFRCLLR
jgi:hypothetical protein